MLDLHLLLKSNQLAHIQGYRLRFYHGYKTFLGCSWKSPPSFDFQQRKGMRSRTLTFEASGIDHVGLIQICFSPAAIVSRVSEKSLPVSVVTLASTQFELR